MVDALRKWLPEERAKIEEQFRIERTAPDPDPRNTNYLQGYIAALQVVKRKIDADREDH